jgi:geranylgeranyl diphosphate synthase type II
MKTTQQSPNAHVDLYLKQMGNNIEDTLGQLILEKHVPHKSLFEAARYSVLGGGKRIRPIIAIATAEALRIRPNNIIRPACALELIHTYSLIHDDLPCMDNDDFRRGKPSLHKAYNEGQAVLTGDYLLTYAFQVIAQDPYLTPDQKVQLVSILSRQAGGDGMIAGQVIDIESINKKLNLDSLQDLHLKKTGALITASFEFGGVFANVGHTQMHSLHQVGQLLGLAFQIIDDVLDADEVEKGVSSYVSILGIEKSKEMAIELYDKSIEILEQLTPDSEILRGIAYNLVHRTS